MKNVLFFFNLQILHLNFDFGIINRDHKKYCAIRQRMHEFFFIVVYWNLAVPYPNLNNNIIIISHVAYFIKDSLTILTGILKWCGWCYIHFSDILNAIFDLISIFNICIVYII